MVNSQMNNNLAAVRRKLDRVRQQVERIFPVYRYRTGIPVKEYHLLKADEYFASRSLLKRVDTVLYKRWILLLERDNRIVPLSSLLISSNWLMSQKQLAGIALNNAKACLITRDRLASCCICSTGDKMRESGVRNSWVILLKNRLLISSIAFSRAASFCLSAISCLAFASLRRTRNRVRMIVTAAAR